MEFTWKCEWGCFRWVGNRYGKWRWGLLGTLFWIRGKCGSSRSNKWGKACTEEFLSLEAHCRQPPKYFGFQSGWSFLRRFPREPAESQSTESKSPTPSKLGTHQRARQSSNSRRQSGHWSWIVAHFTVASCLFRRGWSKSHGAHFWYHSKDQCLLQAPCSRTWPFQQ